MTKSELVDYIRSDVIPVCFPDSVTSDDLKIQVERFIDRPTSKLWFVDIVSGQQVTSIVVKCGTLAAATPNQRLPRLTPTVPAAEMISRQTQALQAINRGFSSLADSRFLTVSVLNFDSDRRVFAMNRIPGNELLSCLHNTALPSGLAARKALPFYSKLAGEWLRHFHTQVSLPPGVQTFTHTSELLTQATDWLNLVCPENAAWSARVLNRIAECAANMSEVQRATLHGDYWPGNILVSDRQLGVIDVLGWAEGPVWLDLSYYLLHLRAVNRQIWLQNIPWPEHLLKQAEKEFLSGYFAEETINADARCLFLALALLAKWAQNVESLRESSGLKKTKKSVLLRWRNVYFQPLMLSVLDLGDEAANV